VGIRRIGTTSGTFLLVDSRAQKIRRLCISVGYRMSMEAEGSCSLIVCIMMKYVCNNWDNIQADMPPFLIRYLQTKQLLRSIFAFALAAMVMRNCLIGPDKL
jgi:hypothetical protein